MSAGLAIGIIVAGVALLIAIRRALRAEDRTNGYRTSEGRNMPPRSPARKKRGW